MNVGTVEAKLVVDASDLDKLPTQAQVAMRRAQQEFEKAAKGITAAMQGAGSGAATAMDQPASAATKAAAVVAAAWKRGADAFGAFVQGIKSGASSVGTAFTEMGASGKHVFEIFAGFSLANIASEVAHFVKDSIRELTNLGLEAQRAEESWRRTTEMLGINGEALAASMKAASRDVVDMSDIMIAGSKALAQGLAPEQLTKLMEVAAARATLAGTSIVDTFNNITNAVTNQQVRGLKTMGIVIDLARVYEEYAQKIGTVANALTEEARSRALADAVIEKSARTQGALSAGVLTNAQELEKAKSAWKDYGETIGKAFADATVAITKGGATFLGWAKETGNWIDDLATKWERYKAAAYRGIGINVTAPPTRQAVASATAADDWMQPPRPESVKEWEDSAHALGLLNEAMLKLSSAQATGAISSAQYAAGLQVQLAALQAVPKPLDDVKHKILELQAAVAGANFTVLQQGLTAALQAASAQEAALTSVVKAEVASRASTAEQGAASEAAIHVAGLAKQRELIAAAIVDARSAGVQRVGLTQQLAALDSQIDTARVAARIVNENQLTAFLKAEFENESTERQTQLTADLAAIKGGLDEQVASYKGAFSDIVTEAFASSAAEVAAAQATFDKTKAFLDAEELLNLRRFTNGLIDANVFWAGRLAIAAKTSAAEIALDDASTKARIANLAALVTAQKQENDALIAVANDAAKPFTTLIRATSASQVVVMEQTVERLDVLIAQYAGNVVRQEGFITAKYLEESKIRMARFLTDTDTRKAGQLAEQEFYLRTAEQRNTIDERIAAAAQATWSEEQFAAGNYFTFLVSQYGIALSAGTSFYASMKTLVQDAARASTTFLQDGFFALVNMDFKGLGDAAKAFGLAMERAVLNFLASKAVSLLMEWLSDLFTGLSGSSGGGIFGSLIAGAGALLAKLSSSSADKAAAAIDKLAPASEEAATALSGTASAADKLVTGVSNWSAGLSAALSAIGVGVGIYSLAQGGSAGQMALTAAGTALSLYSLAVSASQLAVNAGLIGTALPTIGVLIAQGFAAVAPVWAAAVGTALNGILSPAVVAALGGTAAGAGAGAGAGTGAAAGIGLGASLGVMAGILAVFAAPLFAAWQGMAAEVEMQIQDTKILVKEITNALGAVGTVTTLLKDWGAALEATHLPATLQAVSDALQGLPDLDKAVGLNAFAISDMVPELRAKIGMALISALDAAAKQGVDASFVTASRVRMPDNPNNTEARIGNADGRGFTAVDLLDSVKRMRETGEGLIDGFGSRWEKSLAAMEAILQDILDRDLARPDVIDPISGGLMRPESTHISPAELNAMLDKEYLTIALRNAVVDIGTMFGFSQEQLAAAGLGRNTESVQNSEGGVDVGTSWRLQSGMNLPSVQAIADVQATLEAAGFKPGEYGKALEAFLISVDANVVNNPAWKAFTDALKGGVTITAAINAAIIATMTPEKFYDSAKVITDVFADAIKALATKQADLVTQGAPQDAIDAIGKQIEAMQVAIKAYAGLVQLYTGLPVEMAAITGDLVEQTKASIDAWKVSVKALGDSVQAAQKAFDEALASGNVIAIQQAGQQLHDVTIAGYNSMLKVVEQIDAAIKGILDQAANLVQMVTALAQHDITAHGSFGTINALLSSLQGMAEHGATAAEKLWAVDQALKAIAAVLPTAIAKFGSMQHAEDWLASGTQTAAQLQAAGPTQITNAVTTAAAPFLVAMQGLIDAAAGPAKLALLQQQAAQWNDLANAAIAGVNQWAQQAIQGATDAANAVIAGLAAEKDAKLAAIDLQITGIQQAAAAEHEARTLAMQALSEQIAKAKELEAAVASMGQFIAALKLGPTAPINPRDQLTIAKDAYTSALAAYNAHPTAAGLTNLQQLSTAYLAADEKVYSKPAPHHIALFNLTLQQLEAAKALAAAQVTDSQVLQAQLDALQALDKTETQAAQAQIDALNAQKKSITDDFETQTKAIQDALADQVKEINKARDAEITKIQEALATALTANAAQQAPLIAAALLAQEEVRKAIGDTHDWQIAALAKLQDIYNKLALAIPAPKLASGAERVTEGLYHLHNDEAVLPKAMADEWRAAMGGRGIRSALDGAGLGLTDYVWSGPMSGQLNYLQEQIQNALSGYQSVVNHNEYKSHGKIYHNLDAAALAQLKQALDDTVASLQSQMAAILAAIPPPVVTPPVVTPGTPAPVSQPHTPAGPGWLNNGTTQGVVGSTDGGVLTVVVQLDGKQIGKAVLPSVLTDARTGGIHEVIVKTKPQ